METIGISNTKVKLYKYESETYFIENDYCTKSLWSKNQLYSAKPLVHLTDSLLFRKQASNIHLQQVLLGLEIWDN